MAHKKALIVGPFGVIGRNLVHYLSKQEDWHIVGLSRRSPALQVAESITDGELKAKEIATIANIGSQRS